MSQNYINEPARQTPILLDCDVLVVGGGTSGVIAAIASARQGVKTILVERLGSLGGLLTVGMNTKPSGRLLGGIGLECWDRAQKEGFAGKNITLTLEHKGRDATTMEISTACDAEGMKMLTAKMCAEAGVRLIFESLVVAPIVNDSTVGGVILESKSGRQAITAKVVVDCSADADIAVAAGAPFVLGKNGVMQPVSMFFKMNQVDVKKFAKWANAHPEDVPQRFIDEAHPEYALWATGFNNMLKKFQKDKGVSLQRENITLKTGYGGTEIYCNNTRVRNSSGVDVLDISDAILELYRQIGLNAQFLKEEVPGFENAYINAIAPTLGVRETRHIVGGYTLNEEEAMGKGRFEDSIGVDNSAVDYHETAGSDVRFEDYPPYEIPYRAIVPQNIEQVVVGGRTISSTHEAHGRTRTIPACMTTGQAAGFAAALAVKSGRRVRDIDIKALQQLIRDAKMPLFVSELPAE
ncbi:membrane protein [Betaproteobacteria bacterium]|nr:membrane protein [Betaproteobacteria bacterium]